MRSVSPSQQAPSFPHCAESRQEFSYQAGRICVFHHFSTPLSPLVCAEVRQEFSYQARRLISYSFVLLEVVHCFACLNW